MKVIRGKRAMVTGAASGIGRAIALRLAREGADLFLVDINGDALEAVARECRGCGVEAVAARCDLSDPGQISATVARLRGAWGHLNILINNAGLGYYGYVHAMSGEQWRRLMSVNLLAPIQLFRELLPALLSAEDAHVLNVCGVVGLTSWRKMAAYQTSKFGLVGFTTALHAEYYRHNFGVTALCPGFVDTPLLDGGMVVRPGKRKRVAWIATTPDAIAARAIRAIHKNQRLVVVTGHGRFYWWLTRLSPGFTAWLVREGWRRKKKINIERAVASDLND